MAHESDPDDDGRGLSAAALTRQLCCAGREAWREALSRPGRDAFGPLGLAGGLAGPADLTAFRQTANRMWQPRP
jgi:hypothetical protein